MNVSPALSYSSFIEQTQDGENRLSLMVEGIHCAGCIARIEKKILEVPDVRSARLNFSTRRLVVTWQGDMTLADQFAQDLIDMGYPVHPFHHKKDTHQNTEERTLLFALGVSGFAMGNIMLLSFGLWLAGPATMGVGMRDFLHLISALIAIPAVAYAGQPFFKSALRVLAKGHTNMDVPISVGLLLTSGISLFQLFQHGEHAYFDSAVMLMFFLLAGRYLDARIRARARGAASDLLALMEGTATILDEQGHVRTVPITDIQPGMIVLIGMGDRIPVDGVIISGMSHLDLSMVTGESDPVVIQTGERALSGALNISSALTLKAEKNSSQSFLSDIIRLMEVAEQGQAHYVRLADRAARLYTPVVHILALISFLGWVLLGSLPFSDALLIAATVLIITCPCALGLAVPVVQVLAVGRLMKRGILVKVGDALERLAVIDTVVLDKTGTLTLAQPVLQNIDHIALEDMQLAASMASCSKHPLARALMQAYDGPVLDLKVQEFPGQGLMTETTAGEVRLGQRLWCGLPERDSDCDYAETWMVQPGHSPVHFIFHDPLRPDAGKTVQELQKKGLKLILLSGDQDYRVQKMAEGLNVDQAYGGQTPAQKYAIVESLKAKGHHVMMVGDGLNDAPVLVLADVSISPSSAMDIAQNAADIVFTGQSLGAVQIAYDAGKLATQLVRQNFILAIFYNLIAIPVAMAGYVTPLIAALAMSGSSLVVIANSYRLRKRI